MNIYIDEAGTFVPPTRGHRYSLVLALRVPNATEVDLFYEFLCLRDAWPIQAVEIKGSKLGATGGAGAEVVVEARGHCRISGD